MKGKKGVRVTAITPDSPAERAKLKPGDLLLKLDGRVINARRPEDSGVLPELIRSYPVDATIEFDLIRESKPLKLTVALEPRPKAHQQLADFKDDRFEFTASELSQNQRRLASLTDSTNGIAIEKVEAHGWAALGGLVAGDILLTVNGADITSLDMLKKSLTGFRETKPRSVVFFVRRGTRTLFLEIEPWW